MTVRDSGLVFAADIPKNDLDLMAEINDVAGVQGVKTGFQLAYDEGMEAFVSDIREFGGDELEITHDHQKFGNDVGHISRETYPDAIDVEEAIEEMAEVHASTGVDRGIIFSFGGGYGVLDACIDGLRDVGVEPVVGSVLTNDGFHEFIKEDAPEKITRHAASCGVTDYIVPGTNEEAMQEIMGGVMEELPEGLVPRFDSPGYGKQEGKMEHKAAVLDEVAQEYGREFDKYFIVGSAIHWNQAEEDPYNDNATRRDAAEYWANKALEVQEAV